nr:tRNA (adenosine(37)-N6)-threonylcarbamoyltransferase complex dimerization subunit type 1 TsaB [Granulicella sp. dw_53]
MIHTAGAEGTVALAAVEGGDRTVVAEGVLPGRSASERLVPEIRRLLEGAGWRLAELAAVVVVHGPGSFTGVRVGLSAAKGLSEAGGVALIAVSRLALLANAVGEAGLVHAVLDAGRGEFYYGAYEGGRCLREALLTGAEVAAAVVGSGVVVACEAKVAEGLPGLKISMVPEPVAASALSIALERLERGEVDDAAVVDANYLRRTDFEIQQRLESRAAMGRGAE